MELISSYDEGLISEDDMEDELRWFPFPLPAPTPPPPP